MITETRIALDRKIDLVLDDSEKIREYSEKTLGKPANQFVNEMELLSDGHRDQSSISRRSRRFGSIVGDSSQLDEVLDLVDTVSSTESTVLIEGETGTGKELIARAVHDCSKRAGCPFVKLNCATIPIGLLESELFGYEKGAFTGAFSRKMGRFKIADHGTLFLDEIGDLPFELQAKLLRVLQEGEFEMLGGTLTHKVNVRLVAATNADLRKMVAEKKFREDLYYRINVFPIALPPLRERAGDIPILIRHFVSLYAEQMQKQIEEIPPKVMQALIDYAWPGNVRELQNLMERSVILSPGKVLQVPLEGLVRTLAVTSKQMPITMEDAEREHIIKTLQHTRGVISGPRGAAVRLGIKRSTLYFRMRRLGISANSCSCRPIRDFGPQKTAELLYTSQRL
jgi:transcriptional regulator with GAF, ATPase, and Fis domain